MEKTKPKSKRLPILRVEGIQSQGQAPLQEDYFEVNPEKGVFILADGFGGSQGKKVSKIAVQSIRQFLEQQAGDLDATLPFELRSFYSIAGNALFNAVAFANQKVNQTNQGRCWLNSGGASAIAGYLEGRLLSLAQVGCCSLYLSRKGRVKQIVAPRSLSRQMDPLGDHPEGAQVPLMSYGTVKHLEPEIVEIEVQPGDQLYFFSSGLSEDQQSALIQIGDVDILRQNFEQLNLQSNGTLLWVLF